MEGHLTHGSPVNFSGRLYKAHFYGVEEETGRLDYENIRTIAKEVTTSNAHRRGICLF